jgi:hypothetical protein
MIGIGVARMIGVARQHVGDWFKRLEFSHQRPITRDYVLNPHAVQCWRNDNYLIIEQRARVGETEKNWGDVQCEAETLRSAVKPEAYNRRSDAPKGQPPVIRQPAKRFSSSFISAMGKRGKLNWMGLSKALDANQFPLSAPDSENPLDRMQTI